MRIMTSSGHKGSQLSGPRAGAVNISQDSPAGGGVGGGVEVYG